MKKAINLMWRFRVSGWDFEKKRASVLREYKRGYSVLRGHKNKTVPKLSTLFDFSLKHYKTSIDVNNNELRNHFAHHKSIVAGSNS